MAALRAKSGRLHAISQVLRERRSIGSDCQASNCWCQKAVTPAPAGSAGVRALH